MKQIGKIYLITNTLNDKKYVGQTIKTLKTRFKSHKYDSIIRKKDYPINLAIRKYGVDAFKIELLETDIEIDNLDSVERRWIAQYDTYSGVGYNATDGGRTCKVSDKTKAKMSKSMSGKNNPFYGRKHSEESVNQMKQTLSDMFAGENNPFYGKKHTDKSKQKMSSSQKGHKMHDNTRSGIRKANLGNQYTKGRKLTDEQKKNISNSLNGRKASAEARANMSLAQTGEKHPGAKLTEKDVLEIRAKYIPKKYSYKLLGKEYGVSHRTIESIITRRSWSHI